MVKSIGLRTSIDILVFKKDSNFMYIKQDIKIEATLN